MEEKPSNPMEGGITYKIIRRSIYTFLQHYQNFTSTAAFLAFPFSVSLLLSQAFIPSSSSSQFFFTIHNRLNALFSAAGFPPSSNFFSFLNLKLSETISSSIFSLPFTLSFLLIAKGFVIQSLNQHKPSLPPSFSSIISIYSALLVTYIYNSLVIISVNATSFSLLIFAYNFLEELLGFSSPNSLFFFIFSAAGAVFYSIILANALVICNLALVSSGMTTENHRGGGYMAILKACVMIRGRNSTALSLALPVNLILAAIEALFQYRVVRTYHLAERLSSSMLLEGVFIAYLYSILIVFDTIVSCMFFKSIKTDCLAEQDGRYNYCIEIEEEKCSDFSKKLKTLEEEFP